MNKASKYTIDANKKVKEQLHLENNQDFEDAKRGFIAPLNNNGVIKNSKNHIVWDLAKYDFIKNTKECPDTVNPSLWRQAQLLTYAGLFKVTDRIYQIRGADISNMTIIEGDEGIIVIDPLLSIETAQEALSLYYQHRPNKPVSAIIYTHSHLDHFGGAKGIISQKQVDQKKIPIIAPKDFTAAALEENLMAGNAMIRRSTYMYGNLIPISPVGQITCGLGLKSSEGQTSLILPTESICQTGEEKIIDGIKFVFLLAQHSEAPAEMLFFLPELNALCAAEDATHTMHNLYSLRGAKVRDAKAWAKYLNETIEMFGVNSEVVFAQHHWPIWGNTRVIDFLEKQRDMYKYLHDQTLRLANQGYTMTEIGEMIKLPKGLEVEWYNQGYYGSTNHNVKSVYNFYLGWFDGNPSTLDELPRHGSGQKYIEYMGGIDSILDKAKKDYNDGNYRWVAQVLNHVVCANPDNQIVKNLLADTLEQLGYQTQNATWRNFYLTGAQELRNGINKIPGTDIFTSGLIDALRIEQIFDYLAIRLNGPKAVENSLVINLQFLDTQEQYNLEIKNGVLHYFKDKQSKSANIDLKLNRNDFINIITAKVKIKDLIESKKIKLEGDKAVLGLFFSLFDSFDFWFNIVEPVHTKAK